MDAGYATSREAVRSCPAYRVKQWRVAELTGRLHAGALHAVEHFLRARAHFTPAMDNYSKISG
ncbi:hypothetical protein T07_7013 [Trichinella nelsoni]|uniref:Uncharacterized protein n=1 Tax=Trichinella nelsoni TaxID=6336 RepID=A0A0V0RJ75_9BILA|nr:hypothetical protein T07_7013 [Trichinella nelsoni]